MPVLLPVYAAHAALRGGLPLTAGTAGPLPYLGMLSSAVAFLAWNAAVAGIGAARDHVRPQPLCVALLAYLLPGETMPGTGAVAMALVLGGVALGPASRTTTVHGSGPARPLVRRRAGPPGGERRSRVSGRAGNTGNRFPPTVGWTPPAATAGCGP
ncbi:hypothetical protein I3F58_16755 [Streptomyces sp. MUM 203J]|uniref:DMT family transporter n=1 Tax=Streptomyces sp. MUM 203J TaxID=2791990 RepID=UPI001F03B5C1|nr:DMT family transporter [Streptomyces sp. MUM 203J]MCH0541186.1 hypothetical protein [Streptomyces sp. MUM 203J]